MTIQVPKPMIYDDVTLPVPEYVFCLDNGNRFTKITNDGCSVVMTPAIVADEIAQYTASLQHFSGNGLGQNGALVKPFKKYVGQAAILNCSGSERDVYGNLRHFNTQTTLNQDVEAIMWSAIRSLIPEQVRKCYVYLCVSVARKEYMLDQSGKSKFADSLADALERTETLQFKDGTPVEVIVKKVLVRPQSELAVYGMFAEQTPGGFVYYYDRLYHNYEQIQRETKERQRELKAQYAKGIVVFDIGGLSAQRELVRMINNQIRVVQPATLNDFGVRKLLGNFKSKLLAVVDQEVVTQLSEHDLLTLFETEMYKTVSVSEAVSATITEVFPQYFDLFERGLDYTEVDTVFGVGQLWKKDRFRQLFEERLQERQGKFVFDVRIQPERAGLLPVYGGYALMNAWKQKNA